jgi:IclR family transcriptional regulator, KDG regulon repressor
LTFRRIHMNEPHGRSNYELKLLKKTFDVLDLFDEPGKQYGIQEIYNRLKYNRTALFRIIKNLEEAALLERDAESRKYYLGYKLFVLGSMVEPYSYIRRIAKPFLEQLSAQFDETVQLVILRRDEALYIDRIEGTQAIRAITNIGTRFPTHCTGVGKVLLAALPDLRLKQIIKARGLRQLTPNTLTTVESLQAELDKVRHNGYAIDNEEAELGLKCVAAPLFDSKERVVAAISISGPRDRFQEDRIPKLVAAVKATARKISADLKMLDSEKTFLQRGSLPQR